MILVLSPMLAVVLAILNFGRRRYFSEHIIFSLHAYAWWLLWLLANLVILALVVVLPLLAGRHINLKYFDYAATSLEFGGLGVYLFFAGRRFYQDKIIPAVVKAVVLTFCAYQLFHALPAYAVFHRAVLDLDFLAAIKARNRKRVGRPAHVAETDGFHALEHLLWRRNLWTEAGRYSYGPRTPEIIVPIFGSTLRK